MATRHDLILETGADLQLTVGTYEAGEPIPAGDVVVGQYLMLDGHPLEVTSVEGDPVGMLTIRFGAATWADPYLRLHATDLVIPADPVEVTDAEAAWRGPSGTLNPITATPGPGAVELSIPAADSQAWGSLAGSYSWDLYVQAPDGTWKRLLEGSLVIVAGDARSLEVTP